MSDKAKYTGAAGQTELDARKAELDAREAAFAERERAANRKESEAFCERLMQDGKLTPGLRPRAVAIMDYLSGAGMVEFAETGGEPVKKAPLDYFRDFLKDLPKAIEFSEIARGSEAAPTEMAGFGPAQSVHLAEKAQAYQRDQAKLGRRVDIGQAVRHLTGA